MENDKMKINMLCGKEGEGGCSPFVPEVPNSLEKN